MSSDIIDPHDRKALVPYITPYTNHTATLHGPFGLTIIVGRNPFIDHGVHRWMNSITACRYQKQPHSGALCLFRLGKNSVRGD
jgi:hypothetical protein